MPLSQQEKRAVNEIRKVVEALPGEGKNWDWSKASQTSKPIVTENFGIGDGAVAAKLNIDRSARDAGLGATIVPGLNGSRPLIIANRSSEFVLACGGRAEACVNKHGIVIATDAVGKRVQTALLDLARDLGEEVPAEAVPEVFGITAQQWNDPAVKSVYRESAAYHEIVHASEPLLDSTRADLYTTSEWKSFRHQADYLSAKLGISNVSDGVILKHIGEIYGLGPAYSRSVLECFAEKPEEAKPWLPGGSEFAKLLEITKKNMAAGLTNDKIPGELKEPLREYLKRLDALPFKDTDVAAGLRLGVKAHFEPEFMKSYARENPGVNLSDASVTRQGAQYSEAKLKRLTQDSW